MGDELIDPYALPEPTGSSQLVRPRDATSDRIAAVGLVAGAAALVAFATYWLAFPSASGLWFDASVYLMATALFLGLASLVLSHVRGARRGPALIALLVAVSPVVIAVAIVALAWGTWWVFIRIMEAFGGVGY